MKLKVLEETNVFQKTESQRQGLKRKAEGEMSAAKKKKYVSFFEKNILFNL